MNHRLFGRTGVWVSPLCLGTMNFGSPTDAAESSAIILRALDAGINMIDTADVYNGGESERIVGQTLKDSGKRDQVFLATKVFNRTGEGPNDAGASRYHIIKG
ncbi:MAG TPA: aldo/keto reductase, partial [Bellilinea sp.]